jgi:hypothetical protein
MRQQHSRFPGVNVPALITGLMMLVGCSSHPALRLSHWHLPWHRAVPAAPVPVTELGVEAGTNLPPTVVQYWNRNTLRVDLAAVGASGSLILRPSQVNGWPMRIEFAVRPGSLNQLEVRGDKRVVFNIAKGASADGGLQVLELGAGVYSAKTLALTVSWN